METLSQLINKKSQKIIEIQNEFKSEITIEEKNNL